MKRERTTVARLEKLCEIINKITNNPKETYEKGTTKSNVGNYCLQGAYGGWNIGQIVNESGAIRDVLGGGYKTKRELDALMCAFIAGLTEEKGGAK